MLDSRIQLHHLNVNVQQMLGEFERTVDKHGLHHHVHGRQIVVVRRIIDGATRANLIHELFGQTTLRVIRQDLVEEEEECALLLENDVIFLNRMSLPS
jgi:hypothetical protein